MVGLWAWLLLQAAVVTPPLLDPNVVEFPDSSLVDFGPLRDGDRKGHGYLKVDGQGHFVWADGRRARFWGINVAVESVFQPFDRIDTCVERIRRAGFNLVRIHHVDGTDRGILKPDGGRLAFDEPRLKCLDYWIDRLGRAGIGVYLDLLDFREFSGADGVLNASALGRGAKPYAVFDDKLIALQQLYAKALLRDHVNPFNGMPYADDPAVVMLELFDENGLFIRRRDWSKLASPFVEALSQRWNAFLLKRYGSTEALAAAWARSGVPQPLFPGQRVEAGTVSLPEFNLALDTPPESAVDRLRRAQASDAARFAYEVHRAYFRTMRDYLRKDVGVKVPLSAVGDGQIVPDLLSVAEELDFIGTNYYWDHPAFRAAREWQLPYFFRCNSPLTAAGSEAFAPIVAAARMSRKPLVVREWNHCFPNPDRATGMLDAAAYAALQDVDAMVLFTYGTIPTQRKIGLFDVHQDPARWGVAGVLGEVFMSQAVAPARRRVEIAFSDVDTFLFKDYHTDLHNLAWTSRVATRCFPAELTCDADLTINSGRSSAGVYHGGPLLLSRQDPSLNTACEPVWVTPSHFGYPLPLAQGGPDLYYWDGTLLYDQGVHSRG
ncbi:MAG: hypothetical protein HYU66_02915, partial [Armatimonadetes bacterium]|nr:hypothetical protein [Armatimonadota bacterium]